MEFPECREQQPLNYKLRLIPQGTKRRISCHLDETCRNEHELLFD